MNRRTRSPGISHRLARITLACVVGCTIAGMSAPAHAGVTQAALQLGRMWTNPEYDGAEGWHSAVNYPAGIPRLGAASSNPTMRGWVSQGKKFGTYLMSTNWTDPNSLTWDHMTSSAFRSYAYEYPESYFTPTPTSIPSGLSYVYPVSMSEAFRWDRPSVRVGNIDSTTNDLVLAEVNFFPEDDAAQLGFGTTSGIGPRDDPQTDPTLVSEEVITCVWRYTQGVELTRSMYAYPYGSPHQDYALQSITLTNNGISGRVAGAPELTNQTLQNVVWGQAFNSHNFAASEGPASTDIDGMYVRPWGTGNHYAVMMWDSDDAETPGPDWGDPATDPHYQGHLLANGYVMIGPLFVSAGPGGQITTDDPAQPAFRLFWSDRGIDCHPEAPPYPQSFEEQRDRLCSGGWQMPDNTSFRACSVTDTLPEYGQISAVLGYGPLAGALTAQNAASHGWDMGWGESVRIVQMIAAGGIDQEEARRIGNAWNVAIQASADPSTYMSAADVALVQTGRDTVMKAAALAYWNYWRQLPSNVTPTDLANWGIADLVTSKPTGRGEYDVPDAPRPPGAIVVLPDTTAGKVAVRWTREAESLTDHDTGVADFAGYRVWRQTGSRTSPWVLVAQCGSDPTTVFAVVSEEGSLPAGLAYLDSDVATDVPYWYSVTAYDDGTQNWARSGKSLESGRWWTWTGYRAEGVTVTSHSGKITDVAVTAPAELCIESNTPNPFNPSTTINFSTRQAGHARVCVYDVHGQLVRTLVENQLPGGRHSVVWDGSTEQGLAAGSGVYIVRLMTAEGSASRLMTLAR